jgi:hypothetical protein
MSLSAMAVDCAWWNVLIENKAIADRYASYVMALAEKYPQKRL